MPAQTITIRRHGGITDTLESVDVLGDFAVYEHVFAWMLPHDETTPLWTVGHVPSGYACLHTRTKRAALAARRAFVGSGDWRFTDPAAMSEEQKRIGKEIKREWEGR